MKRLVLTGRGALAATLIASLLFSSVALGAKSKEQPKPSSSKAVATSGASSSGASPATKTKAEPSEGEPADGEVGEEEMAADAKGASASQKWRNAATIEQKAKASELFREGNSLVKDSLFVQAVEKYDAALAEWDHPGIHYNLALALLNLDQPLRLRKELVGALKFGADSLGEDKARRAEQYLRLVEKQLTEVHIVCEHAGAKVELDGQFLFEAPGSYSDFVRPGPHRIKASVAGFEPTEKNVSLISGEKADYDLKLYTAEDWIRYERRWSPWGPIIVTASGVLVAAAGGVVYWQGIEKNKEADDYLAAECPSGCSGQDGLYDEGNNLQLAGIVTMGVGGAAALTGAVLLYLNRQRPYRVDPSTQQEVAKLPNFSPVITDTFMGFSAQGVF